MKRGRSADDSDGGDLPDERQPPKQQYKTSKGKGRAPTPPPISPLELEALLNRDVGASSAHIHGASSVMSARIACLEASSARAVGEHAEQTAVIASLVAADAARVSTVAVSVAANAVDIQNWTNHSNFLAEMLNFLELMKFNFHFWGFGLQVQVVAVAAPNIPLGILETPIQVMPCGTNEDPVDMFEIGIDGPPVEEPEDITDEEPSEEP